MTADISTQFLHCENSKQLWEEAQSLAGVHTRYRITYLKSEFHSTGKGEMKMHDYLSKMKILANKLKLAGNPILNSYLIIQPLNGLDSEYNHVVVKLSDQINLSWIDLQSQLLSFESRIEQLNSFNNLSLNASANVAHKTGYKGNWRNNRLGFHGSNGNWRGFNSIGWRGGRGRGRFSKPTCQVCSKTGHTSVQCFYRFDKTYSGSNHSAEEEEKSAFLASQGTNQEYD